MNRAIARYNESITIQKNTVETDQYHNHKTVWADFFTCYAYASTLQKEERDSEVTVEQRQITFETRYCSELAGITSTGYRVLFHSDAYNIVSVDMMNYQRQIIRLKCEKEARG